MPIWAKASGSSFKPAPAGPAVARCCDVVDLGMVKSSFKDEQGHAKVQHKVRLVWQLADPDPETGKRPIVSERYTLSLHEKATLRQHLESWRGRLFTDKELAGFDVETVIGVPAYLNIVHAHKEGSVYANVRAVMPPPKGSEVPLVEGYTRVCERSEDPPEDQPDGYVPDDDTPF